MTDHAQTVLMVAITAYTAGCFTGVWLALRPRRDRDWRCSFNHENTNRPSGPPPLKLPRGGNLGAQPLILNEGRTMRGNGIGGPTATKPNIIPKPQFPSPRIIRDDFLP